MWQSWSTALLLVAWLLCPLPATALEPEVQAAKDEGMRLYNIGESTRALPFRTQQAVDEPLISKGGQLG